MGVDIFAVSDPNVNDEDLSKIEIDKEFARRFEHNKKREDLQRFEELKKKGVVASSSDDSSDDESLSSDDEPQKDLKFYDALVKVKKQDPILNQKDAKLFESSSDDEDSHGESSKRKKKEKPMYLKDVNYKYLTEEGPEFGVEKLNPKVYNEDQAENIKAFFEAEKGAFGSDDDGDIIKEKVRNGDEMEEDENAGEIQKKLDEYFGEDDNLNKDDMFLKNYLLNKMWVDKEKEKKLILEDIGVSEDEDELEKQDKYEAEYNFRHEEVEGDRILGHARFTEGSVRKKTSSRKAQRKSKEERMAQAEFERKEELKHLKNLKKKEIQEKLEKVRAIAGFGDDGECKLGADDLEEDFDPEEYDKKMKEMFGVDYYGAEDADPGFGSGDECDLEKPDFGKEDELLGLPKDWDVGGSNEGFEATRERILKQQEEEEELEKGESKRKRKRKITLKEKVELDKELEEYYKLDYEDTIGDLKTRFKYKQVPANKFGLGAEEILIADDKDLNQYVSLKKLAPYREKEWKVTYHQKLKKSSILLGETSNDSKKSKKHEMKSDSDVAGARNEREESEEPNGDANTMSRRMKRRRRQAELKLSRSRLIAYGKIPSKPQKKKS
ncbi:protein KRI1 homolog [Asparagus officinalis]|uniref:protein KRI1 homolog n=1 Tax=Asparagus officinalis TaxID=4686 RepID=UPI00098E6CA3|nr:protein KRI1 homolog [Asparagus officinalis]